jgi:hypothetical protein
VISTTRPIPPTSRSESWSSGTSDAMTACWLWLRRGSRGGSAKGTLANILQGTVEGNRKRGRPKGIWMDDVKDWTGRKTGHLIRLAEERTTWCCIVNSAGPPQWLRDMMMWYRLFVKSISEEFLWKQLAHYCQFLFIGVWAHGDYVTINSRTGGILMLGRRYVSLSLSAGQWLTNNSLNSMKKAMLA